MLSWMHTVWYQLNLFLSKAGNSSRISYDNVCLLHTWFAVTLIEIELKNHIQFLIMLERVRHFRGVFSIIKSRHGSKETRFPRAVHHMFTTELLENGKLFKRAILWRWTKRLYCAVPGYSTSVHGMQNEYKGVIWLVWVSEVVWTLSFVYKSLSPSHTKYFIEGLFSCCYNWWEMKVDCDQL